MPATYLNQFVFWKSCVEKMSFSDRFADVESLRSSSFRSFSVNNAYSPFHRSMNCWINRKRGVLKKSGQKEHLGSDLVYVDKSMMSEVDMQGRR